MVTMKEFADTLGRIFLMKRTTAIVFSCDNNYAPGVLCNIMSLEDLSPNLADKYMIYCDSWCEKYVNLAKSISSKVEIIPYEKEYFYSFFCSLCVIFGFVMF